MPRQTFYEPTSNGYECSITERLRHSAQLRDSPTEDGTATSDDD
jgi:putative ATPase